MTNNPTIDGVRKLAEQACGTSKDSPEYKRFVASMNPTLLLDLTAPVVERQEPEVFDNCSEFEKWWCRTPVLRKSRLQIGQEAWMSRSELSAPPQIAELQAMIARIEKSRVALAGDKDRLIEMCKERDAASERQTTLVREVSDYLDGSIRNAVWCDSILHKKMKACLDATQRYKS